MKYLVRKGDTLWDIWKRMYKGRYSWTDFQKEFLKLNPGKDPSLIIAGEYIELPDAGIGWLGKVASENPWMFGIWNFILGAFFMIGTLWLTKKLEI